MTSGVGSGWATVARRIRGCWGGGGGGVGGDRTLPRTAADQLALKRFPAPGGPVRSPGNVP